MFDGGANDMPVGATIRAWGPTDEVFISWDRRQNGGGNCGSADHQLRARAYACSGSNCSSPSSVFGPTTVGTRIGHDYPLETSMSIYRPNGSAPRELDFVQRIRWDETAPFCGALATNYCSMSGTDDGAVDLDLVHETMDSTGSVGTAHVIDWTSTNGTTECDYRGASYTRTSALGWMKSSFTDRDSPTGSHVDEVHLVTESSGPTYTIDVLDNDYGSGAVNQEHSAFELDGTSRLTVLRSHEGSDFVIRLRFDDGTSSDVVLNAGLDDGDHPDISVSSTGMYYVVWAEGSGSNAELWMAECDAVSDGCESVGDWTVSLIDDTGLDLQHASLQTDGDVQLLTYMVDVDSGVGVKYRVGFRCRSGTGSWSTEEIVQTPATATWDQVMIHGRSHTAADRDDNVFHVVFVEGDDYHSQDYSSLTDGDLWWASRDYSSCL